MKQSVLEKLNKAINEAGFEIIDISEETEDRPVHRKQGDIRLRISPRQQANTCGRKCTAETN